MDWYALWHLDTFADEEGRTAHLGDEVAKTLFARVDELFTDPPDIEKLDKLTLKSPAARV
jgi:hypothetical protein